MPDGPDPRTVTSRVTDPLVIDVECASDEVIVIVDGSPADVEEDDDGTIRVGTGSLAVGSSEVEVFCGEDLVETIDLQLITTSSRTPGAGATALVMLFLFMMMTILVAGPQSFTGSSRT